MEKTIHQGRNIKRFREMLGLKQQGLANKLGDDWDQRKISLLEQKTKKLISSRNFKYFCTRN